MKTRILVVGVSSLSLLMGCTTGDKTDTPADTATGQPTIIAPADSSAPVVLSSPVGAAKTKTANRPKTVVLPKTSDTSGTSTVPPLRDSAIKPKYTVDEKGNIHPIKRDSLH